MKAFNADRGCASGFARILHADWSVTPRKRYVAEAVKEQGGWRIGAPERFGSTEAFIERHTDGAGPATLAAFDFPLGVPAAWASKVGVKRFDTFLRELDHGLWPDFFNVAERTEDIAPARPFYPRRSRKGVRRHHLVEALEMESFEALYRMCERGTPGRRPTPLFWTLGASQVGKAAISGWREVILPARAAGASLWPFDGRLAALSTRPLVLCESWPTLASERLEVSFAPRRSKRRQVDRAAVGQMLLKKALPFRFDDALKAELENGFGPTPDGEDPFDALLGLLHMVAIVEGRLPLASRALEPSQRRLEGWIAGL